MLAIRAGRNNWAAAFGPLGAPRSRAREGASGEERPPPAGALVGALTRMSPGESGPAETLNWDGERMRAQEGPRGRRKESSRLKPPQSFEECARDGVRPGPGEIRAWGREEDGDHASARARKRERENGQLGLASLCRCRCLLAGSAGFRRARVAAGRRIERRAQKGTSLRQRPLLPQIPPPDIPIA